MFVCWSDRCQYKDCNPAWEIFSSSIGVAIVTKYITKGWKDVQEAYKDKAVSAETEKLLKYLEAVDRVKHTKDELEVIHLIEEYGLVREHLLTNHLKSKEVGKLKELCILFRVTLKILSQDFCLKNALLLFFFSKLFTQVGNYRTNLHVTCTFILK